MTTIDTNVKKLESGTKNYGVAVSIFLIAIVLPVFAMSYYAYANIYDPSVSKQTSNESSTSSGAVAVLGANNQFSNNQTSPAPQQTPPTQPAPQSVEYSLWPYSFALPDGWTSNESQPCPGSSEARSTTYINQSKTVIIYENTRPAACGGAEAADSYLDYDFSDDSTSIVIGADTIVQCTKQENPACPKGDGKVSVFLGNQSPTDPTLDLANSLTNNTYFISLTDTNISGDFSTQVTELSSLSQLLTIN